MSEILDGCPVCGKQPERHVCKKSLDEDSYYVIYECRQKDHTVSGKGDSDLEAIEAWNTRHERTCRDINPYGRDYFEGKFDLFTCSECGWDGVCDPVEDVGFCPSCGAKVIEQCQ